ncbi:MAG: hypothetical protein ACOCW1_04035 [Chitinispirillaceae bacterium]
MISKIVSQYLEKEEAEELKAVLESAGIGAMVRRQGLPRIFASFQNYLVLVDPKSLDEARPIVDEFTEKAKQERKEMLHRLTTQCPFCKSQYIAVREKKSLVHRIFYYGVTLRECEECGKTWFT